MTFVFVLDFAFVLDVAPEVGLCLMGVVDWELLGLDLELIGRRTTFPCLSFFYNEMIYIYIVLHI